ncbi:hypothetical protein L917_01459, partial [Phytophthora nicotianae]
MQRHSKWLRGKRRKLTAQRNERLSWIRGSASIHAMSISTRTPSRRGKRTICLQLLSDNTLKNVAYRVRWSIRLRIASVSINVKSFHKSQCRVLPNIVARLGANKSAADTKQNLRTERADYLTQ